MFEIIEVPFGNGSKMKLLDTKTGASAEVLPDFGGALYQITINFQEQLYPILWASKDAEEFINAGIPIYKGALLFPFADRVEAAKFTFQGNSYQLNPNAAPHALHGFLNDKKFEILSKHADDLEAVLKLKYQYKGEEAGFPFPFTLINSYKLTAGGFELVTEVINNSDSNLPYAIGWHPYFLIDDLEKLEISLPANKEYLLNKEYINFGNTNSFDKQDFFKPELKEGIYLKCLKWLNQKPLQLKQAHLPFIINIETPEENGYNYFQIYINKENKGVGLEPLTGIGNCFNNQVGLTVLTPNQTKKHSFSITSSPA